MPSNTRISPDMKKAKQLVEEAFNLVGADMLRILIMELGTAQLTMAVTHLYSDRDWVTKLMSALYEPNHAQIQMMCKMIDKLLPSPQAVRTIQDTPDQLIIQYAAEEKSDAA